MTHRCKSKQKRRKLEIRRRWKRRLKRKKLEQKLQKQQVEQSTPSKIESTENS
ncbi:MAG: hypothetical protein N2555_03940 [Endomicrobia bacterium]|nr:hypothetical protein [Endomicrobiia bacterium]